MKDFAYYLSAIILSFCALLIGINIGDRFNNEPFYDKNGVCIKRCTEENMYAGVSNEELINIYKQKKRWLI